LNGHEYLAIEAKRQNISFTKEGNCFTDVSDAAGLAEIADTMRAPCSVGRLVEACERWIYSACLCFALDLAEQQRTGFGYSYSVYQGEYSRNLLFTRGCTMEQVFQSIIDRTRAPLDIKAIKTIFGRKHRPFKKNRNGKGPRLEVVVERPAYLTVFKVHWGKMTVKIYSKGERVLRIEVIAHNTRDLPCGRDTKFPRIIESLKAIKVREIMGNRDIPYQSRQASYDLKKLRGKELVCPIQHSRRYQATLEGLRTMAAFIVLREKVLIPLLANGGKRKAGPKPRNRSPIDIHYDNIQIEMQKIFQTMNIAA
jgi:hypothetical protein